MEGLKRVAIFANPNGHNHHSVQFAEIFSKGDQVEFQVVSLAERLAEYTNFPSPNRKKRLEEILSNAAVETARSLSQRIKELGHRCNDPEIVNGRFPESVEKWLRTHNPDLLVKQSLPCDGEFGHASKGDLRLSRHVPLPIMLLNNDFPRNNSIMSCIPPVFHDGSGLSRAVKIINQSVFWARKLDATIHMVHAWELFGESFLRSRLTKEELNAELDKARENAEKEVKIAVKESRIPEDIRIETHVHKGDPTRVLIAELELLKPTLVVMGSVANEGVKGALLGNTAETIARRKLTNTLIIK